MSEISSEWRQVECMVKLSKALLASTSELLALYDRRLHPISLKLSKGVASLPDELLVCIFEFAQGKGDIRNVLWFSHVSRRFRRLIVGHTRFWSNISLSPFAKKEKVEMQLARGGEDIDFHIVLKLEKEIDSSTPLKFMDKYCSTASRWRSLTVKGVWDEWDHGDTIFERILALFKERHFILPRLQEIYLEKNEHGKRKMTQTPETIVTIPRLKLRSPAGNFVQRRLKVFVLGVFPTYASSDVINASHRPHFLSSPSPPSICPLRSFLISP